MVVQEHFNDLVVGTYGRGFWILDDLTPIQQMSDTVRNSNAYLFPPRPTYRFRPGTVPVTISDDPAAGQNPPYGAAISYYLKSAPSGDVKVLILDANGQTVRTINGTKTPGINRVTWDLRSEQSKEVRLRTSPAYAPEIRLNAEGWRPLPEGGRMSLLLAPGTYTVKLTVAGQELTQPLVVLKDPNSSGSEQDIQQQTAMLLDIRKDMETVAEMVNQIEVIRSQLDMIQSLLQTDGVVKSASNDLDKKLIDIEENLIQRRLTAQGQDTVRWPPRLISKLNYLANGLSGSADFPPTNQQREVHAQLKEQLATHRKRLDGVVNNDLSAFNKLLRERNIQNVIASVR